MENEKLIYMKNKQSRNFFAICVEPEIESKNIFYYIIKIDI